MTCQLILDPSHPHIYGIDLASTSELIAYHKSPSEIAAEIDADEVIYQTVPDLIAACAELSPRDPATQRFEVGVFTGEYITPVHDGYLEHLDGIRGGRKAKVQDTASQTVVNGVAGNEDLRIVVDGVELDRLRNVLLARPEKRQTPVRPSAEARETQDISLHNLNDHDR